MLSNKIMNEERMPSDSQLAIQWRQEQGYTDRGGVVVVYRTICGAALDDFSHAVDR